MPRPKAAQPVHLSGRRQRGRSFSSSYHRLTRQDRICRLRLPANILRRYRSRPIPSRTPAAMFIIMFAAPRCWRDMANNARHPWTGEQAALASELARDGHTLASIARRLGRSRYGVGSQLRKMGIKLSEARWHGKVQEIGLSVSKDALRRLEEPATQRAMQGTM